MTISPAPALRQRNRPRAYHLALRPTNVRAFGPGPSPREHMFEIRRVADIHDDHGQTTRIRHQYFHFVPMFSPGGGGGWRTVGCVEVVLEPVPSNTLSHPCKL